MHCSDYPSKHIGMLNNGSISKNVLSTNIFCLPYVDVVGILTACLNEMGVLTKESSNSALNQVRWITVLQLCTNLTYFVQEHIRFT